MKIGQAREFRGLRNNIRVICTDLDLCGLVRRAGLRLSDLEQVNENEMYLADYVYTGRGYGDNRLKLYYKLKSK